MTRDEVCAAAKRVTQWHQRFTGLFGRKEAQAHSLVYVKGLLSDQQRKCVEPIALRFARGRNGARAAQKEVVAMQGFITASPWKVGAVFGEIQAVFGEELVPTTKQWCGRLGKTQNCQVGVFLTGVTPGGTALLDAQLFLPEEWIKDRSRRTKTRVPGEVKFQSKPQIAAEMIGRTLAAGKLRFDWITADELYGDSGDFLDALEALPQRYLVFAPKRARTARTWT